MVAKQLIPGPNRSWLFDKCGISCQHRWYFIYKKSYLFITTNDLTQPPVQIGCCCCTKTRHKTRIVQSRTFPKNTTSERPLGAISQSFASRSQSVRTHQQTTNMGRAMLKMLKSHGMLCCMYMYIYIYVYKQHSEPWLFSTHHIRHGQFRVGPYSPLGARFVYPAPFDTPRT